MNLDEFITNITALDEDVNGIKIKIEILNTNGTFTREDIIRKGHNPFTVLKVVADLVERKLVHYNTETQLFEVIRDE